MKESSKGMPDLLPGENPAQYLVRNWDFIAPNAYLNYELKGPGAVSFDFTIGAKVPQSYFSREAVASNAIKSQFAAQLLAEINSYNPREEVVLTITTPDKRVGVCKGKPPGDHLSPFQLFKQLNVKMKKRSN